MGLLSDMALPAVAGGIAVCFSHPLELTKTRLQLDNERAARGTPRKYASWIDCWRQNWRKDGLSGLQRGLQLGIAREVCFNAVRIGLSDSVLTLLHSAAADPTSPPAPTERLCAGLACGALGGCCVNPIEVLKVRMQAQGGATGHQHGYAGLRAAVQSLWREEGVRGCFRGVGTSTLRGLLGPGSQLVAYNELKRLAAERGADAHSVATHIACALCSAAVSILCVNPVDVVRTRVYNQPRDGSWYTSGLDAARQLVRKEGWSAFYKGAFTHYLRLGPHMVLVFGILEQLKAWRTRL
ncbi:hypothetical protein AB1Y20_016767 [Prymnesium parvum]|uniref:Mitochondrial carrier protein n=1 Tax=Prymnesium parvum TaxID=97485 RepID=A0AB34IBX8_PRYPA